jgi:hypothetical protein
MIFRVFILLLTLSITVVAFLGGLSAVMILSDPTNIGLNTDDAEINIDFDLGGFQGGNFTLPFNVTNAGYFDLENLQLNLSIGVNYSQVDYPDTGFNQTRHVKIFEKNINFGTVLQGQTEDFVFSGDTNDFINASFPDPLTINYFRTPRILEFYANFTISLDYSIGMHSLSISVIDLLLGGVP